MPKPRTGLPAADLARTVVFAAFIAVLGIVPGFYIGAAAVPIVVQNMGPLLAGSLLGARRAGASVGLFLVLVAIGLPLLSGGRGGIGAFAGPTGGFMLGWLVSAVVVGLIVSRTLPRPGVTVLIVANLAGIAADYLVGIPYWAAFTGDLSVAGVQSLAFVPGDAVKIVLVSVVAAIVHRALQGSVGAPPKSTSQPKSTAAPSPPQPSDEHP